MIADEDVWPIKQPNDTTIMYLNNHNPDVLSSVVDLGI